MTSVLLPGPESLRRDAIPSDARVGLLVAGAILVTVVTVGVLETLVGGLWLVPFALVVVKLVEWVLAGPQSGAAREESLEEEPLLSL